MSRRRSRRRRKVFVKRPGSLREILMKHYGKKAFYKNGKIKPQYVDKLKTDIKTGNIPINNPAIRRIVFGKITFYKNIVLRRSK